MGKGSVQQTTVSVTQTDTDFYGDEWGYSSINSNALGYTWAKYNSASDFRSGGYDRTWGGQAASWGGSETPAYIKLYQSVTVNVINSTGTLTIGWPPSYSVSPTKTSSTATWSSESATNVDVLGAEHQTTEISEADIQGGQITSFVYNDSADIKIGSTIYRPASSVRFTNGL
ncbi:hypothetical protein [Paenibacillus caui]|uniref:hypothetical protein n=1 Tax=Paenibacillus caui TaxID=2873927 RepID=UPI001CA8E74D|nr:hypothetical protein [Paenibacillus caui]